MLHATSLSHIYPSSLGIEDITFNLRKGEICAIFGPHESGKSTLLRVLHGDLVPQSGDCRITDPHGDCQTGFSDATVSPTPRTSLFDWIYRETGRRGITGPRRSARAMEALSIVGLHEFHDQSWCSLSGGRRLAGHIAFAACGRPSVILLDGLLDGMSTQTSHSIFEGLRDFVQDQNLYLIFSTVDHRLGAMADKVLLLDRGRQIGYATPQELVIPGDSDFVTIETVNSNSVNATLRGQFRFTVESDIDGSLTLRTTEAESITAHLMRHSIEGIGAVIIHRPNLWTAWNRLTSRTVELQ